MEKILNWMKLAPCLLILALTVLVATGAQAKDLGPNGLTNACTIGLRTQLNLSEEQARQLPDGFAGKYLGYDFTLGKTPPTTLWGFCEILVKDGRFSQANVGQTSEPAPTPEPAAALEAAAPAADPPAPAPEVKAPAAEAKSGGVTVELERRDPAPVYGKPNIFDKMWFATRDFFGWARNVIVKHEVVSSLIATLIAVAIVIMLLALRRPTAQSDNDEPEPQEDKADGQSGPIPARISAPGRFAGFSYDDLASYGKRFKNVKPKGLFESYESHLRRLQAAGLDVSHLLDEEEDGDDDADEQPQDDPAPTASDADQAPPEEPGPAAPATAADVPDMVVPPLPIGRRSNLPLSSEDAKAIKELKAIHAQLQGESDRAYTNRLRALGVGTGPLVGTHVAEQISDAKTYRP
ncbi:MAG: hypothetical protein AB203_01170 [Parcubacteria bacterium C7867-008]|nr:MAG: hypothetical protein AB203_01170 [Parcubacteria bacterium C7867-008]